MYASLANHPRCDRGSYRAVMSSWPNTRGPVANFRTIRECGRWAENFRDAWDRCVVTDREYRKVAEFRRDLLCVVPSWFRAER
jgi:hypothetical protein